MACTYPCVTDQQITDAGGNCSVALPDVEFDICRPKFYFGQISDIFLTNIGVPFGDINLAQEWSNRLSGEGHLPGKIIRILGIGDKPAAEGVQIEASYGRFVTGIKTHTINFKVDEVSAKNYQMMRHFECNRFCLMWYKTYNGMIYGGNEGVRASISFNHVIPENSSDLETLVGTLKWKAKHHPCRDEWVLQSADEANPGEYVNL